MADQGQLVGGIVGGNLIALRQSGVIEHGLEKVVQSAAETEHGLSHMNEFGGAAADTMTTQQPSVFTVAEKSVSMAYRSLDNPSILLKLSPMPRRRKRACRFHMVISLRSVEECHRRFE